MKRIFILGVAIMSLFAIATPAMAHDHHRHWEHDHWVYGGGPNVVVTQTPDYGYYAPDNGVSIAYGGSYYYRHHHHHHHWR